MATDLETLLVRLEVATSGFEAGLNKAENRLVRHAKSVDTTMQKVDKRLEKTSQAFNNFSRNIVATVATGLGAREIIRASDSYVTMENRLRSATKSTAEYNKVSRELFQVAQSSKQSLTDITDLYFRLSGAFTDAQKQAFPLIDITERLGKAFVATGVSAQQSQAFILQLSQAAAADFKAVGQEINSLIEAAPTLTKAIAGELGLKSASAIKKFAEDGQLNVNNFFEAFKRATDGMVADADKMTVTVAQSLTRLDNAFLQYIGQQELARAGTSTLAASINALADNFETVANVVIPLGVFFGARYVAALTAATGVTLSLSTATGALGGALTFIAKHPVAIALSGLTAAYLAFGNETEELTILQGKLADEMNQYPAIADKLISKNKEIAQSARDSVNQQISDTIRLIQAQQAALDKELGIGTTSGTFERGAQSLVAGAREGLGLFGIGTPPSETIAKIDAYRDKVKALRGLLENPEDFSKPFEKTNVALATGNTVLDKKVKKTKEVTDTLYKTTIENERAAEQAEQLAYANDNSAESYEKLSRELEIKNKLQQQGFVIGTKLYDINEKLVRKEIEARVSIDKTNDAREKQLRAAEEYAEAMRRPIENALEGIQDTISDTFVGIFDGSVKDAGDAADAIKRIFFRMAAEVATLELFGAGGLNIAGSVRSGALGSASGSSGGSITGGILREGTSLLGATKIGGAINAFGVSALPSIFGTGAPLAGAVGPTQAGLLGGAGIGASSLLLPVAGLAIGALASSVFKKKPKSIASNFGGTIGAGGDLSGLVIRTNGKGDPETAKALSEGVQQVAKSLIAAGVDVTGKIVQGGVDAGKGFIGVGATDYLALRGGAGGAINFNPNGGEGAVSQAMGELALQLTNASDKGKQYAEQLKNISAQGRKAEDVLSDISFVLGFDTFGDVPQTFTELEQSVKAMSEQFNQAATNAERLGLSVEKVREAEQRRMADLLGGVTSDIANQILQITSPIEAQIQQERNRYAAQLRDLQAVGAKQQDIQLAELLHKLNIEKINDNIAKQEDNRLQVAQDLEKRFSGVTDKMKGFLFELTNGQYSPLSPTANLSSIRGQVNDLGMRARLGDVDAQEKLGELLPAFVELSGQVNGFNANFEADRKLAEDLTRVTISVAERQVSLQQTQIALLQQQTAVSASGFAGLQAAISRLGGGTVSGVISAASGSSRFGANPTLNQALAAATGFTGVFNPNPAIDEFGKFRAANPQLENIIQAVIRAQGFNTGGLVGGVSGVDANLARLTKGEFVMNTAAVRSVGANTMQSINSGGGDLIGEIKGLRSDMKQLTQVVAMTGQMNSEQLQSISATNARMANIERVVAYRG